uniref:Uncharacterized protein n=1 Tax=viral metagenome TaxID=1070528 RepID=A0A6M3JBH3_9ZZZZ
MKMYYYPKNEWWPRVVTATITGVAGSHKSSLYKSVYRLVGDGIDAATLAPTREYTTKKALIIAATKIGWREEP